MDIVVGILTDQQFLGAILASIVFIFLGFILRRKNVLTDKAKDVLNVLVMKIAIPCMAFCAFMSDFDPADLTSNLSVLLLSLCLYAIFLLLGNLVFIRYEKKKRSVYAMLFAVGQLTFFAIPVLKAVYRGENLSQVLIPSSLMTLSFRLVVYIYCFLSLSATKLSKKTVGPTLKSIFVNPIMIAMGVGLVFWLIQNVVWQVPVGDATYGFVRIDQTCPALYSVFQFGDNLATPLCMLLIGVTLGEANFLSAIKNGKAWVIAAMRMFAAPLIAFGICCMLQAFGWMHFNEYSLAAVVIGMDAPVSAVVVAYCVRFQREDYVASDSIFLSTILSIIALPVFFVLVKLAATWPLFAA